MVRTIGARVRKLRGRQTALDLAFEEWAELRAVLRRTTDSSELPNRVAD
jgi:hypothetical protein